jgi:hypothetical protein
MKLRSIVIAIVLGGSALALHAADKIVGGPKGGRLLEVGAQKAEFFVTKDRKAEVTFYDAGLKPATLGAQVVAITAEPKSGRKTIELEKTAHGYISKTALPESTEAYRVVVQLREKADARPQNYRVNLDLATCGGCKRAEYACTCDETK